MTRYGFANRNVRRYEIHIARIIPFVNYHCTVPRIAKRHESIYSLRHTRLPRPWDGNITGEPPPKRLTPPNNADEEQANSEGDEEQTNSEDDEEQTDLEDEEEEVTERSGSEDEQWTEEEQDSEEEVRNGWENQSVKESDTMHGRKLKNRFLRPPCSR